MGCLCWWIKLFFTKYRCPWIPQVAIIFQACSAANCFIARLHRWLGWNSEKDAFCGIMLCGLATEWLVLFPFPHLLGSGNLWKISEQLWGDCGKRPVEPCQVEPYQVEKIPVGIWQGRMGQELGGWAHCSIFTIGHKGKWHGSTVGFVTLKQGCI